MNSAALGFGVLVQCTAWTSILFVTFWVQSYRFFCVPSLSKENSGEELEFSLWWLAEGMVKEKGGWCEGWGGVFPSRFVHRTWTNVCREDISRYLPVLELPCAFLHVLKLFPWTKVWFKEGGEENKMGEPKCLSSPLFLYHSFAFCPGIPGVQKSRALLFLYFMHTLPFLTAMP